MAQSVIAALQKMAESGRTILATIHQPSSEVYNMFNKCVFIYLFLVELLLFINVFSCACVVIDSFIYSCPRETELTGDTPCNYSHG